MSEENNTEKTSEIEPKEPTTIINNDEKKNNEENNVKNKKENEIRKKKKKKKKLTRNDFLFGRMLGEGAYGNVYYCQIKPASYLEIKNDIINNNNNNTNEEEEDENNENNKKEFAIKIMDKLHIKRENKVKYVMNERKILTKVNNKFIVKLFYTFQDENNLYMTFDLAHGGELLHLINNKKNEKLKLGLIDEACDINLTSFYISEVILALKYLHTHLIIHRDLKPENVLISKTGHVKLTDFGTAISIDDPSSMKRNSFVGTAQYVSPEVLKNDDVTAGCDLWAIGCMLFQMFTGRPPFQGESEFLTFQLISDHAERKQTITYPPSIPENAADLIDKLLLDNPNERLGSSDCSNIEETELAYSEGLQSHPFFDNIDWEHIGEQEAPYQPDPSTFPSQDNLRDGDTLDLLFDGEAELLSISSMDETFNNNNNNDDDERNYPKKNQKNVEDGKWNQFLLENETIIEMGIAWKVKGFRIPRKRHLILTDTPRLIYVDPDSLIQKGEIPWDNKSLEVVQISDKAFDLVTPGRTYHWFDFADGSQKWFDAISREVEKLKN